MTTTTTIVVLGLLSAGGFTVAAALPPQGPADAIPWKELAGGGAALLMLISFLVFLRFLREDRAERAADRAADRVHVEKVVGECTEATRSLGTTFSATQTQLMASYREDNQAARRELQDLVRDLKQRPV